MTANIDWGAETAGPSGPIRIRGLTKRYKDQIAVDGLDLDVPAGSVFGLLGENGAGKTTTIKSILGMVAPDGGWVSTLGLDPSKFGLDVRRRVGYVPEQPVLYDWMTVGEIGWFAAGFHVEPGAGTAGYLTRYGELVRGFGLPEKRRIRELSKGMRSKVSLSLALAAGPELLVLDEPTSGLDLLVRREFLESMVDLAGVGRTVLLSSHQIAEVERVASHVALIHKGKLVLAEALDELQARTYVLTLTSSGFDRTPEAPGGLPLEVVDVDEAPRQARWLVHADDRAAAEAVRSLPGVGTLAVEPANLEEIYIGYMRGRGASPAPAGPRSARGVA